MTTITEPLATKLSDRDLDRLLDLHVFKQPMVCQGYCTYQGMQGLMASYCCTQCGAVEERTLVQRCFESPGGHQRRIPRYTASLADVMPVVEAMRLAKGATKVFYVVALSDQHSGYLELATWLMLRMQPRHIAVAALRAVGILDHHGRLIEREAL